MANTTSDNGPQLEIPRDTGDQQLARLATMLKEAIAGREQRWFEKPSVVVAAMAVVVSVLLTASTLTVDHYRAKEREAARKHERIHQIVLDLNKLASQPMSKSRSDTEIAPMAELQEGIVGQIVALSEEALQLIESLGPKSVSSYNLIAVASSFAELGDYVRADHLFGIVVRREYPTKSVAWRAAISGRALLHLSGGRIEGGKFSPDKGRKMFEELLDNIPDEHGPTQFIQRAGTLRMWALAELEAGTEGRPPKTTADAVDKAEKLLAKAREEMSGLLRNSPIRASLLASIEDVEYEIEDLRNPTPPTDPVWSGICELKLIDRPGATSDCILIDSDNAPLRLTATEYNADGSVRALVVGMLSFLTSNTIHMDWQRTEVTGNARLGPPFPVSGQTILKRVGTEARFAGKRPNLVTGETEQVEYYFPEYANAQRDQSSPGPATALGNQ